MSGELGELSRILSEQVIAAENIAMSAECWALEIAAWRVSMRCKDHFSL